MAVKVTLIGSLPPDKGVSPYTEHLARALAARSDIALEVLCFRNMYPRFLYPGGNPTLDGATVHDIPRATILRVLRWWNPIGWVWRGFQVNGEIVHAQWWSGVLAPVFATLLMIARLRRRRVVVTVHNVKPHESGLLRRFANEAILPLAHRLVVHTEQNKRDLIARGYDASNIDVIPMGVAAPVSIPGRSEARARFDIPNDAPLVLFFGNIRPYKGVPLLLDAFEAVKERVPAARLLICGQPWGSPDGLLFRIEQLGPDSGVVARLGYLAQDAVDAAFAAADVVVFPYTHFDAQSAAACDALRHGKPIVVTDVGGLPELTLPEAVVPARDAHALAAVLERALSDDSFKTRLSHCARSLASARSWSEVARRTKASYCGGHVDESSRTVREKSEAAWRGF